MAFNSLPSELIDYILSSAVPWYWNTPSCEVGVTVLVHDWHPRARELLALRLVCSAWRQRVNVCFPFFADHWRLTVGMHGAGHFRATISREMLRKANLYPFQEYMMRMNVDGLTAMLLANYHLGQKHRGLSLRRATASADAFCWWKASRTECANEALAFRAACSTMAANKGSDWVWKELQAARYTSRRARSLSLSASVSLLPAMAEAEGSDLAQVTQQLLAHGCLPISAFLGDLSAVKTLLEHGADPRQPHDLYGRPLHAAACSGHVDVLRLLVDAGADVSLLNDDHQTPLEAAARHGHLEAVQFLVSQNAPIGFSLSDAIFSGHELVATFLLELRDIFQFELHTTFRWRHTGGRGTITWIATKYGYRHVALQSCTAHANLDPNRPGPDKKTALFLATKRNWADVVEALLLCPRINPNISGSESGTTPLELATLNGYDDIVRLLLSHDEIVADVTNKFGITYLHNALIRGHPSTALLLLEHPHTRPHQATIKSVVPLELAIQHGYTEVVERLLQLPAVRGSEFCGDRALLAAIEKNDFPLVRRLLDLFPLDLNRLYNADYEGFDNILFWAITSCRPGVAEYLLTLGEVDPNLHYRLFRSAIWSGRLDVMRHFLSLGNIDVNAIDDYIDTPLYNAITSEPDFHPEILRCLLEQPNLDVNNAISDSGLTWNTMILRHKNTPQSPFPIYSWEAQTPSDDSVATPLMGAVKDSIEPVAIVELLLDHRDIDPNRTDSDGRTALFHAVCCSKEPRVEVARSLLRHPATDPNVADNNGWTPLLFAVHGNYVDLADLLLQHPALDPNLPNNDGCTPLLLAVSLDYAAMAERLVRHPRTDVCLGYGGRTPLDLANELERGDIITILEVAVCSQRSQLFKECTKQNL